MDNVEVLVLSTEDWNELYRIPDYVKISEQIVTDSTYTTYDRISGYNKMESDYDKTISIGEELANVETTSD